MIQLKAPISVVWEITNNCNFKCPHCRAYQKNEKENIELENKILDEIIKSEIMVVNLSGGEPLLNPRIFEIAKKLSDNNIYVIISTNGYFYEKYRQNILESGIKYVQVSLDGPKFLHEEFRGVKDSFKRAIGALKMAKEDGLLTQMNITITSRNLSTLEWNYEKALEIGVDKVFYRRVVPYGKAKVNDYILPPKEEYYNKIISLSKLDSNKLRVLIDDPILNVLLKNEKKEYLACGAGINNLGISSDGNVYPCIFLREKMGNIKEDSLIDIWNNSYIIKKLKQREINGCGSCKFKYSCGGCRAFSGTFEKDEFCPLPYVGK